MDRGTLLPLSLPVAAVTATAAMLTFDLPAWAQTMAANWGPAFTILAGLAAGAIHYIPRSTFPDFLQSQRDQALAMSDVARSLHEISGQGGKIDKLQSSLDDALINQRVIISKLQQLETRDAP